MTAILVQVAEAIRSELADHDFGVPFEPVRSYADWDLPLDMDDCELHVDVVPFSAKPSPETRGSKEYSVSVDVCIRKKLGFDEQHSETGEIVNEEVDALVELTEQVGEYFAYDGPLEGRLPDVPEASWSMDTGSSFREASGGTDFKAMYDRDHLRELRQYTALIRLSYRVTKEAA